MEFFPENPNYELVVFRVEPVTREAHVVRELLLTVRVTDGAMLAHHPADFLRLEAREGAAAAERVPNVPRRVFGEHVLHRMLEEPMKELGLVADRVGATDHRKIRAHRRVREDGG